ncbi:MAG: helix-turn-helix transcriptional regulator [Lachnospiraceae bacterium]|nr:helix-turn-helix transcriptional regulator [Lachnospiraceae bacterium]
MKEKKEINLQMGNHIRIIRERAGLTQEQFGTIVSLGSQNVSDIERGLVGISVSTLKRICETLPIPSDWLLFGDQTSSNLNYLSEKLKRLPPEQFLVLNEFLNQILHLFAQQEQPYAEEP